MNYFAAISTFVRAAELKSFSAAAKELNIEASTVSRHIADLESDLRIALFNRSTRGLALTEAGTLFYSHATRLLLQWEEARSITSALNERPAGLLRLTLPGAFGRLHVMPHIPEFLRLHPEISLDVVFSDDVLDLIESRIDVGVRIGALPDSSMHARMLAPQRRYAWAGPGYISRMPPLENLDDLMRHQVLMFSRIHGDGWYARKQAEKANWEKIIIPCRFTANDSEALLAACAADLGIAMLPGWLTWQSSRAQHIQRLLPAWEFSMTNSETAIWLVYPRKKIVSSKVRSFIDFMVAKIGDKPYWES